LAGTAFRVEEVAGGYQLMTRSKFAPWLRRLHAAKAEIGLSASAMETLAIVAYRQPALRTEIEAIRGVQSGEVLRQLIERDLVRITGRSNELGRPFLYGTTKQFLQVFGLRRLEELPKVPVFQACHPQVRSHPDLPSPCDTNTLNHNNLSQLEDEEENVKTLSTKPQSTLAEEHFASVQTLPADDRRLAGSLTNQAKEDDDFDEEDDDFDEEDDEDDVEDEDEDDEDLEDEPWEEVEDEDEEEEDWDEDEDWDDEDWDEDEDEEEEEEEPEGEV
jgi:segregation and condensation protein B